MKTEEILELDLIVKGEVIQSNMSEFRGMVHDMLSCINSEPKTDVEFGQAEIDVKNLKKAEESCLTTKANALKKMEDIDVIFAELDQVGEDVRGTRLDLQRKIKAKKEEMRSDIEDAAVDSINSTKKENYRKDIVAAMKNKRTIESLTTAAMDVAEAINMRHAMNKQIINAVLLEHGAGIAPDHYALLDMDEDALHEQLERRIELKVAEDERKRLENEATKAQRELDEIKRKESEKTITEKVQDKFNVPDEVEKQSLPEPPKVDTIPTTRRKEFSEADELKLWKESAIHVFQELKLLKMQLVHNANFEKVDRFSDLVNQAWKEVF